MKVRKNFSITEAAGTKRNVCYTTCHTSEGHSEQNIQPTKKIYTFAL